MDIFTFQWICLPIILLILVGVELPLRVVVTILECCVTFSGVKLSIRSFVLFLTEGSRRLKSLPRGVFMLNRSETDFEFSKVPTKTGSHKYKANH